MRNLLHDYEAPVTIEASAVQSAVQSNVWRREVVPVGTRTLAMA